MAEEQNTEQTAETPTADEVVQLARMAAAMRSLLLVCSPRFAPGSEADGIIQAAAGAIQLISKCMKTREQPK